MTYCIPSTARNDQCDIAVDRHGFHTAASSHIHDHKCGPHPTQKTTKVTSGSLLTLNLLSSTISSLPSPSLLLHLLLDCLLTYSVLIPPAPHPSPSWYSSECCTCVYHNSSFCCRHVGTGTPPSPAPSHTPLSQKYVHTDTTWYVSFRRGDSRQDDTAKCSSGVRLW